MDICRKYVELHDKIKHIRIAMLTLHDERGRMRSLPMVTMQTECEGNIWFFSSLDSDKINELSINPSVSLSYTDQSGDVYVSISGTAEIIRDEWKMKELWKPVLERWFPSGLNTQELCLLKIRMEQAEYWNGRNMIQIWDTTDAVFSGTPITNIEVE